MQLEYSRQISKKTQISTLMKIRSVEAELSHAEGQTDRQVGSKLTVLFVAILRPRQTNSQK